MWKRTHKHSGLCEQWNETFALDIGTNNDDDDDDDDELFLLCGWPAESV